MILIADSGSTKTSWRLIHDDNKTSEFRTSGINPFYQSAEGIQHELQQNLKPQTDIYEIERVYFYGAGCHFEDKKQIVRSAMQSIFENSVIEINSDLLAVCRALFGKEKGIACILGTGSNSCFYDGCEIKENVSPLGFMLGDEGSGAVLGKLLVADVLKNQLSEVLKNKFLTQYNLTTAEILDKVYKQPFPNRFLAQFAGFLHENSHHKPIYNIIYKSFEDFFMRNVMQYDYKHHNIGFVGSIAYYFNDILATVAMDLNINISTIVQSPMDGLQQYHQL